MIIFYYIRFFFYRGRFAHWWRPLSRGDNQVNFGGNPPLRTPFHLGGWIRSAAEHTAPQLFFFLMSFSLSLQTLISIKKKERSRKKGQYCCCCWSSGWWGNMPLFWPLPCILPLQRFIYHMSFLHLITKTSAGPPKLGNLITENVREY